MNCILTKVVKFRSLYNNAWIVLEVDTIVYVDIQEGIAYCNENHFTIERDEYLVMD